MDNFESNPEINNPVIENIPVDQSTPLESQESNDPKILELEQKVQTQGEEIAMLKKETSDLKSIFASYLEIEYNREAALPTDPSLSRLRELANIITAIKQQ